MIDKDVLIITVSGSVGSGVTTMIKFIQHHLDNIAHMYGDRYRIECSADDHDVTPFKKEDLFNIAAMAEKTKIHLKSVQAHRRAPKGIQVHFSHEAIAAFNAGNPPVKTASHRYDDAMKAIK